MEKFIANKKSDQDGVRNEQFNTLLNINSTFVTEFITYIQLTDNMSAKQYFIHWLQIILNKWSREIMPAVQQRLYQKHKEIRQQLLNASNETDNLSASK